MKVPAGFKATRLYTVPKDQGSWVSLANETKGRLVACNQYGKLYRITPTSAGVHVVELAVSVGNAQGLLHAFGGLYVMGKNIVRGGRGGAAARRRGPGAGGHPPAPDG